MMLNFIQTRFTRSRITLDLLFRYPAVVLALTLGGCASAVPGQSTTSPQLMDLHRVRAVSPSGGQLCNSDVFAQIPNHIDYFIGRVLNTPDGGVRCVQSGTWSLAFF